MKTLPLFYSGSVLHIFVQIYQMLIMEITQPIA